jgi:hypothetical protein
MRWRSIRFRYLQAQGAAGLSMMWLEPVPLVVRPHFRPSADVYDRLLKATGKTFSKIADWRNEHR